mmetsp:Transcript_14439/g.22268  ORF Transcript_14439/g.22268 Transcript_14439/m.22268 type:complete len:311 (+) Transcript_14439:144-1076(+)|eukprot:CAMPEP_0194214116 /NCGR_PEP_ID=MMETSP0156-20130528/15184_1 /TAXON_ID=33649 /ORGANISM="Thalassionema nitzschioides, Strain L26-B" /LENGTH=310 /DNA_ID=CAMNT_0038942309 /DNA_START=90 /DNA_END=1022 /DNA_ORIENTATION=-
MPCSLQIVMGPAGSGKSTYCQAMQSHADTLPRRKIHVANMDPAAETFGYNVDFDIRELISVTDVMEELELGPNGSLVYCMEYLLQNGMQWFQDHLDEYGDDDYLILDCPGQVELYTHIPVMRQLVEALRIWGYESKMVGVFCVDATFLTDTSKFLSGSLLSLTAMIALELPHVNVLTKCDLVSEETVETMLSVESATQLWDWEQNQQEGTSVYSISDELEAMAQEEELQCQKRPTHDLSERQTIAPTKKSKWSKLTTAISSLLDDYTMVSFLPLNINEPESMNHVLATMDHTIQFEESQEVYTGDGPEEE